MAGDTRAKPYTILFEDGKTYGPVHGIHPHLSRDTGELRITTKAYGGETIALFRGVKGVYMERDELAGLVLEEDE